MTGPAMPIENDNYVVSNKEPGGYAPYGRLQFHSDMMWAPEPFQVLSLYGLEVELAVGAHCLRVHHRGLGRAPGRPAGTGRWAARGQRDRPAAPGRRR